MTAYAAIVSARFRMLLQYRAAAAAGLGTQLFWGIIRMMIFEAFFRSTSTRQPMTYAQTLTYIWLGQAMFAMLAWMPDQEVRQMIRTGTVAYEMLRPVDVYWYWYARAIASRTAPTVLRAVPMFILAGLFFGLGPPVSLEAGIGWIAATAGALVLGCAFTVLMTISLMWTVSGEGVVRLVPTLVYVFSGMIVPLPFFPDWAQATLTVLPFRGMADAPFRVYAGSIPAAQIPLVLLQQAIWTLVLVLAGRWLLARGTRHLVVQGG